MSPPRRYPWWLLLACACACSQPEPHDFTRLTDVWVSQTPAQLEVSPQASLGGVTRIGIPIRIGGHVRIRITVPEDAQLRGYVGVSSPSGANSGRQWTLDVGTCDGDAPRVELESNLGRSEVETEVWSPLQVDVSMFALKEIDLCFVANGKQAGEKSADADVYLWLADISLARRGSTPSPSRSPNLILLSEEVSSPSSAEVAQRDRPNLHVLARQGELLVNALSNSTTSGASHAALFSGLHPSEMPDPEGVVRTLGDERLSESVALPRGVTSLPELFWALGFATAGIPSESVLDADFGFAQGFDLYDVRWTTARPDVTRRDGESITDAALAWLGERNGSFFLFLNYPQSTSHLDPLDAGIGRLVAFLRENGIYEKTMIAVVSNALDTRAPASTASNAESASPIPDRSVRRAFVVKYARPIAPNRVGARYSQRVDLLDLRASVMREMGLREEFGRRRAQIDARCSFCFTRKATGGPPPAPGLYGLHEGRAYHFVASSPAPDENASDDSDRALPLEAVYHNEWKLVRDGQGEVWLYDLSGDPFEEQNIAQQKPVLVYQLEGVLNKSSMSGTRNTPIEDIGRFAPSLADFVKGD